MQDTTQTVGTILGIAIRPKKIEPAVLVNTIEAVPDKGLVGEHRTSVRRGVTLLAAGQWREVVDELGTTEPDLPWHTRRANVLIECAALGDLIGQEAMLGDTVRLKITKETAPCSQMDGYFMGLQDALRPACRGGVCAQVIDGGVFAVGDILKIL